MKEKKKRSNRNRKEPKPGLGPTPTTQPSPTRSGPWPTLLFPTPNLAARSLPTRPSHSLSPRGPIPSARAQQLTRPNPHPSSFPQPRPISPQTAQSSSSLPRSAHEAQQPGALTPHARAPACPASASSTVRALSFPDRAGPRVTRSPPLFADMRGPPVSCCSR